MQKSDLTFTSNQLCALLGVTRTHVARLEREGIVEKLAPGRYAASSVTKYIATLRARSNATGRYSEARCRKMEEQALLAEMNRKQREGELIAIDDLMRSVDVAFQACRTRLLAIPHKLVPRLNGPADRLALYFRGGIAAPRGRRMTTTDQTLSRASCALAGALACDDPEAVRRFTAIIAECFARSELSLGEFERQVTAGLHPVLDCSTVTIAERTAGATDEAEVSQIIADEMFGALARAGRRILT